MKATGSLLVIATVAVCLAQQPPASEAPVPKGWRAVHEKHGCVLAVPREWPVSGSNWLGPKDREIDVIVRIMPRTGPVANVKQRIDKTRETIVEESESKIWLRKGMTANSALDYAVRQEIPKSNSICSVHISIQNPSDLPKYGEIANQIAKSVHAE